ncbi:phosphatase PAP2 family protein [Methanopyrus kandleri]
MGPLGVEVEILRESHGLLYPWMRLLSETSFVVIAAIFGWTYLRDRRTSYVLMTAVVGALLVTVVLKGLVGEPRPFVLHVVSPLTNPDEPYGSFPSGHTSRSFALAAAYHLERRDALTAILWIWAALVGCSRVVLGVHWPHDVIGGTLVGITVAAATHRTAWLWVRFLSIIDPLARGVRAWRWYVR